MRLLIPMRQYILLLAAGIGLHMPGTAVSGSGKSPVVRLGGANLELFRDCSIRLWYDSKRGRLMGEQLDLNVPRKAVRAIRDEHATISVDGTFHGIRVKEVFVPIYPLDRGSHSDQNSLRLAANIQTVKLKLESVWRVKYIQGLPEGPDRDPGEVAYYFEDPQFNPNITAQRAGSSDTWLHCPTRPR